MLNRYALWKYVLLVMIILLGFIYALPNLYGEDPAIQITAMHGKPLSQNILFKIQNILHKKNIKKKSISLEHGLISIRFPNTDAQLLAHESITRVLGKNYITALYLSPATPHWLKKLAAQPIKLGLDLRGGIYFLMQVDLDTALKNIQKNNMNTIIQELHAKKISYRRIYDIPKYGIEILFKDDKKINFSKSYLSSVHPNLIFSNINPLILRINLNKDYFYKIRKYTMEKNIQILSNRINQLGITEPIIQRQGSNYIVVELPGIQDSARAKEIIGSTSSLEFHLVNNNINYHDFLLGRIPDTSEIKHTRTGDPIVIYKKSILTGDHIIDATSTINEYSQPQVNIIVDSTGGAAMSNVTKDHMGQFMATVFVEYKKKYHQKKSNHVGLIKHEEIINVARIQSRFSNNFCITGINDIQEARQLSLLLRAGSLIAPMQIAEERIIGPTMGQENIKKGMQACLLGLIIAIIFMVFFYKIFGIICTCALLCNLVLIIGIMSLLPGATLTMPGIAGIVLTLAVAVDANVLINERIKEELLNGRPVQQAIHQGYKRAFSSIFDANITMLIKVIILYAVGTGSIKGFAITTAIGIVTSMFTSIVGTRAIVNFLYGRRCINKLSI